MSSKKIQTTPAGIGKWVCVNKPSTKFNPDGVYSVDLALPAEDAEKLVAEFKAAAEAKKAEAIKADPKNAGKIKGYAVHVPGEPEVDGDGNETGNVILKFKANALIKPKDKDPFEKRIGVFDAKGKPLPANVNVGKGSKLKVAYEVVPFCAAGLKKVGVSLRLQAVQVLELVKYQGGQDAGSFGFGTEDGYTADDEAPSTGGESTEGEAPAGDGNGDF
jgi:hypothetical protein